MTKKFRVLIIILLALLIGGFCFQLRFERLRFPLLLILTLFLLPLAGWLHQRIKATQKRLGQWAEYTLLQRMLPLKKSTKPLWQIFFWLSITACLMVALARPQGAPTFRTTASNGLDILIGLDISDSMRAADVFPSRLSAAKEATDYLLNTLQGDRIGLMVFAGTAFPFAPFSLDHAALATLLDDLSYDLVPSKTTNLEEALRSAQERFQRRQSEKEEVGQVLILISDGENQLGQYQDDLETLAKDGVRIFTIGTGTRLGARIPEGFMTGPYKTWRGQAVKTQLDEKTLKKIASIGQGEYLPIQKIQQLPTKINKARSHLGNRSMSSTGAIGFEERFQAWLLLALGLFLLEHSLPFWHAHLPGRWHKNTSGRFKRVLKQVLKRPSQATLIFVFPLLMGAWSFPWESFWQNYQGQKAYEDQKYPEAQKHYSQGLQAAPKDPALKFNQGNTLYRSEQYEEAAQSYQNSVQSEQLTSEQQAQSWYNLGNSYYRQGQKNQNDKEAWKKAIEAYQEALKRDPEDQQAQENLQFVQKQLEQQNKQNNGQQKNPKNEQQKQDNQSEKQQNQGQKKQPEPNTSNPENHFTNQALQSLLQELKNNENQNRQNSFQRVPPSKLGNQIENIFKDDDSIKDW